MMPTIVRVLGLLVIVGRDKVGGEPVLDLAPDRVRRAPLGVVAQGNEKLLRPGDERDMASPGADRGEWHCLYKE